MSASLEHNRSGREHHDTEKEQKDDSKDVGDVNRRQ